MRGALYSVAVEANILSEITPMPFSRTFAAFALGVLLMPAALAAEEFETVTDEREFVSLIEDRELKRFAINLRVKPSGEIVGKGFGRDVTGDWAWREGYFCRDLLWGGTDLGFNCQQVQRKGSTIRFIENKGAGRQADLQLR
jgi:hypothetical protein